MITGFGICFIGLLMFAPVGLFIIDRLMRRVFPANYIPRM